MAIWCWMMWFSLAGNPAAWVWGNSKTLPRASMSMALAWCCCCGPMGGFACRWPFASTLAMTGAKGHWPWRCCAGRRR